MLNRDKSGNHSDGRLFGVKLQVKIDKPDVMSKTVLILGAGVGGIVTAHELSRLVGNEGDVAPVKILLFEKEEKNVLGPLLLWLMAGKRKPEQVYRSTRDLEGEGIDVVLGTIEKVSPEEISVTVNGQEYKGDYMVVSLGMEQRPYHRLNDFGFEFYTVEGADALHESLEEFKGGKVALVIPSLPVKGPTAPYQAAMLIEGFLRKKELTRPAEVALYSPEVAPLPYTGTELSEAIQQLLAQKGIKYFPQHRLVSATPDTLTFDNGVTVPYDLLVYTPRYQCPEVIRQSELVGPSGWIDVDPHTLETSFANVYAIGDITSIPLEMGDTLPKTGVVAQKEAKTVAYNIAQSLFGSKEHLKAYKGEGELFLETGDGKAGVVEGNFYSWPFPELEIKKPHHRELWSKIWSEKYWWFRHF